MQLAVRERAVVPWPQLSGRQWVELGRAVFSGQASQSGVDGWL